MAETNGLLNRRTGKSGTEGSNPSVSASQPLQVSKLQWFGRFRRMFLTNLLTNLVSVSDWLRRLMIYVRGGPSQPSFSAAALVRLRS